VGNGIVFITGATGFVGSAVARELLREGFLLRVLVRKKSSRANLTDLEVDVVEGDMRDKDIVFSAAQGSRYVIHLAADYRLWAPPGEDIMRANVEGTRVVMEAAQAAGAERIVYTSSVATLRLREDGAPADETASLGEQEANGAYKRSKIAAEQLVAQMIGRGLPAIIVNPSTPIGPRDLRPTPTGRMIIEAGTISRFMGRPPPRIRLPRWPIYPVALAAEAMALVTRREPFITLDGLRMAKHHMFFTSAKAERELGYKAKPAEEGIRDAIDWFREAGFLS
jgi:dihydroflavonol-4-reductase